MGIERPFQYCCDMTLTRTFRKMAGEPFKVGRFAHSLRVRLMREHIGIDVDALDDEDARVHKASKENHAANVWDPDAEQRRGEGSVTETSHDVGKIKNMLRDAVLQGNFCYNVSQ